MKIPQALKFRNHLATALLAGACLAIAPGVQANDWNAGVGDWSDPANWIGGVPDSAGGWAIGNIGNDGTAIVSTSVPSVSEAWAGNNGIAGTIIVTNGGTLTVQNWLVVGRNGDLGNTPLSTLIVSSGGVINKSGDGFLLGDGNNGTGEMIVTGTGIVNVTGGWNGIGNGTGEGWLTLQDNAVYNVSGQDWNIGDWGTGRGHAFIKDNATLNVSRFWIGKGESSFGAVWQSGGTILGTGGNANEWCIGGDNSAAANVFGFYQISGGVFANPFNLHIGRWGKGVFYQSGGLVTLGSWSAVGREANGIGVVYITGGEFHHTNSSGPAFMIAEQPSQGELTLAGTGLVSCANRLVIGNGGNGFFNLNGGTLQVPQIVRWNGSGYLNFNGGTLQAAADQPAFMAGLTEVRVYAGNAIIDTAGHDINVGQALMDGAGQGVLNVPIVSGGEGYQAPPVVQIFGDGFGALAVAQIDPAAGTVTNILITCPGYNYTSASAILVGGAPSTEAQLDGAVVGAVAGGGVVKNGAGTLTLSGGNSYTGATIVNGGTLITTTDSTGAGSYTVADNAGLGVNLSFGGAQLAITDLIVGSTTGAVLDLNLGAFGNPFSAPLAVIGNLTANGVITVHIATALPQLGQFPLIQYASRSGAGSFVIGSLPTGVAATIVTNAGGSIDLNITAVAAPRWEGNVAGGVWDIGLTANWIELSTSLPAYYAEGNAVTFDDTALGTTSVDLAGTVNPAKVTVNNSALNYTLSGSGNISGTASLTKQGSGSLALNTVNDYTGVTRIEGGTLNVTNLANGGQPSAIGSASSAVDNLVLVGGTLSYAGPAVELDRGYSVQGAASTIETISDLRLSGPVTAGVGSGTRKAGAGQLTYKGAGVKEFSGGANPGYNVLAGTLILDGTGVGQTNHSQNEFWVGSTIDTGAHLILSNTVLNVDSWLAVGRGNGAVGNVSTATLYDSQLRSGSFSMGYDNNIAGNLGHSTLTLNGSSTLTNNGDMNLGESGGSTATILLNDNATLYSGGRVQLGWHAGATGILTLADASSMTINAWFPIGNEGGVGIVNLKDDSRLWVGSDLNVTDVSTGEGTLNLQNTAQASFNNLFVGKGEGSIGIMNQSGGTALGRTSGNEIHIGFRGQGTYNLIAGSIVAPNHWFIVGRWATGPGEFNVTGGAVIHGTNDTGRLFRIGEDGAGVLNLSGAGAVATHCNEVTIGWNATGDGTLNLNGGSFQARRIIGGAGLSTFNFNGGVLRAGPNANVNFMTSLTTANVLAGGAVIDTADQNIGIAQALLDGGGNGGLTKQGLGALYLNGANTYLGTTLVNAGTLGGSGVISGPVTVSAAGTLAPGTSIGTLTINNSLTLNGTTVMEISKDDDVLASDLAAVTGNLAFGGILNVVLTGTNALAVNDSFNLFDWGTRSGEFTTVNLPEGYSWDITQLTVDGTISVTAVVTTPVIDAPTVTGGNLILQGTGGTPAGSYHWLTSTDVAAPLANWTTNLTGAFDGSGSFSNAIPINTGEPARFFQMKTP
ncbi:MAG: autotransporter-associated beta strand repeat-containing protein [Verrucomicrobia bacterium]|nr:autotransporter-associated beta strand repeat-containing protein [Verrucomicrobiota bacterium]